MPHLTATPGQTIGPFYGYALPFEADADLVPPGRPDAVRLHGVVTDGAGSPVPDALLEVWQADADGSVPQRPGSLRRDGWTFTGWGRCATDDAGGYSFTTVRPGATEPGAAPFFLITVFARGLTNRLFTRAYLPHDQAALEGDRLLAGVPAERRSTLIAAAEPTGYRFDVRLQGADETVFLTYPGH
ncbi:protocatechuate 3,4-dioxygenase subunit alpha [Aeromicrobium endophyticum]|uniref:Protocatechuate 3,4-dioxygenase subunit alpha n=1 Tax=Aeromicrobium endophyticum TaxID=2292704 RepID=A0A371PA49_9ACTN|nr:protocatechuate 3,4-dioxygenase subunit alpha [Aeromicrobium endophyticum]REK72782.1 protocatechuate 3,4-dioxygenase subunit alpha [Aeromicrobium endophyticum]